MKKTFLTSLSMILMSSTLFAMESDPLSSEKTGAADPCATGDTSTTAHSKSSDSDKVDAKDLLNVESPKSGS